MYQNMLRKKHYEAAKENVVVTLLMIYIFCNFALFMRIGRLMFDK